MNNTEQSKYILPEDMNIIRTHTKRSNDDCPNEILQVIFQNQATEIPEEERSQEKLLGIMNTMSTEMTENQRIAPEFIQDFENTWARKIRNDSWNQDLDNDFVFEA